MDNTPLFFTPSSSNSKEPVLKADFSSLHHEYEVLLEIEKGSQKTKIEYTIGVKFEKLSPSGNPILNVKKLTKTFINRIEPDLITEKISALAGTIFQPLSIEINIWGEAVQIAEYKTICNKWKQVKLQLQKNYAGQVLNSYITSINHFLASPELLFEKIKNDWFLSLYCVPLYTQYKDFPEKEYWKLPSLLKGKNLTQYPVFKSSDNLQDSESSVLIFVQDLDNPDTFTSIYTLDNQTKLIKNIETVITENSEHSIRTEIQCIKTHNKSKINSPQLQEKQPDFDEKEEWQKYLRKKKGFWGRLFND